MIDPNEAAKFIVKLISHFYWFQFDLKLSLENNVTSNLFDINNFDKVCQKVDDLSIFRFTIQCNGAFERKKEIYDTSQRLCICDRARARF